ncbi:hypothetical protein D2Q93_14730 [Alicyclobacillaceae bacterium I2511]|nr:hypothetical protein D2Q93_14730 [Alicyclobacillaceae bacterium I2511]
MGKPLQTESEAWYLAQLQNGNADDPDNWYYALNYLKGWIRNHVDKDWSDPYLHLEAVWLFIYQLRCTQSGHFADGDGQNSGDVSPDAMGVQAY